MESAWLSASSPDDDGCAWLESPVRDASAASPVLAAALPEQERPSQLKSTCCLEFENTKHSEKPTAVAHKSDTPPTTDAVEEGLCTSIGRVFEAAKCAETEAHTKVKSLQCRAAEALEAAHGKKVVIICESLATEHNTSRKTWSHYVHACTGASVRFQHVLVEELLQYLTNSSLEPLVWMQHVLYDETKMILRATYDASMKTPSVLEICKTYVVENEWAVLVRCPEEYSTCQYMLLRGAFAPAVRVCNTKSSEGVRKVLESCAQPPAGVAGLCKHFIRLVETDSDPANLKHKWYLKRDSTPMKTLHLHCTLHSSSSPWCSRQNLESRAFTHHWYCAGVHNHG
eukprot:6471392-Amphidinium_carterae.1